MSESALLPDPHIRIFPAAAGRGKGGPKAHPEGRRSALSVEGPLVNRVHCSGPVRRLEVVPDRGEDRHRMLAAEGRR
jgi:hypothetical protein